MNYEAMGGSYKNLLAHQAKKNFCSLNKNVWLFSKKNNYFVE